MMVDDNKDVPDIPKNKPLTEVTPHRTDAEQKKDDFFAALEKMRPDVVMSEWSDRDRSAIAEVLSPNRVKAGMLTSIPMNCRGVECHFYESCPIANAGIEVPVGEICPVESAFVEQMFRDYVEELDVDVTRMVEVSMLRDLVDQEVQHLRKTWTLKQEHFIQENVIGVDADGQVITSKQLHWAVGYEDKILARKDKLRKALMATRESQVKATVATMDKAKQISDLMRQARQVDMERNKELRRLAGEEMVDEYIQDAEIVDDEDDS